MARYRTLMRTHDGRVHGPIAKRLQDEFGLPAWKWPKLKVIADRADDPDGETRKAARKALAEIDAGRISISSAYERVRKLQRYEDVAGGLSRLRMGDVEQAAIRALAFFTSAEAALRCKIPLHVDGMDKVQIQETLHTLRTLSYKARATAELLTQHPKIGENLSHDEDGNATPAGTKVRQGRRPARRPG